MNLALLYSPAKLDVVAGTSDKGTGSHMIKTSLFSEKETQHRHLHTTEKLVSMLCCTHTTIQYILKLTPSCFNSTYKSVQTKTNIQFCLPKL